LRRSQKISLNCRRFSEKNIKIRTTFLLFNARDSAKNDAPFFKNEKIIKQKIKKVKNGKIFSVILS